MQNNQKKAYTDLDTKKNDYNMLCVKLTVQKLFPKLLKSMYFMLDLFEYGNTLDTQEDYKREHS
jgi:hypothetical protein